MYCWFEKKRNYIIFSLVLVLIGANVYLSIIKGSFFLKKISAELKDTNERYEGHDLQKKIDDMEHIKKSLWIYPITSAIIWISFFILQILFGVKYFYPPEIPHLGSLTAHFRCAVQWFQVLQFLF